MVSDFFVLDKSTPDIDDTEIIRSIIFPTHDCDYHVLKLDQDQYEKKTVSNFTVTHPRICFTNNKCSIETLFENEGLECLRWGDLFKEIDDPDDLPNGLYKIEYRYIPFKDYGMRDDFECWVQITERLK